MVEGNGTTGRETNERFMARMWNLFGSSHKNKDLT